MKVLLSIKPEFVEKIFNGMKKYEYRRAIFKRTDIEHIVVYASAPISKIVGELEIGSILHDEINNLWTQTNEYGGISEDYFFDYFSEKEDGYAIHIKSFCKYDTPICLKEAFGVTPPQSFMYIS